MGRGSEIYKQLYEHRRRRSHEDKRPELRLKPDVVLDVADAGEFGRALGAMKRGEVRNVLLRDRVTGAEVVVVPAERYVDLVGYELESSHELRVRPDGQFEPAGLASSEIELADPRAAWPEAPR